MWWMIAMGWWGLAGPLAAEYVAWQKGRSLAEGFLLGIVLGPIGALVVALLPGEAPAPIDVDNPSPPSALPCITALPCMARAVETVEVEVDPSTWLLG